MKSALIVLMILLVSGCAAYKYAGNGIYSRIAVRDCTDLGGPSNPLTEELIGACVARNQAAITSIYMGALHRDPRVEGAVKIKIVASPSGQINTAVVESSEVSEQLAGSLANFVGGMSFPRSRDGWQGAYTWNFLMP